MSYINICNKNNDSPRSTYIYKYIRICIFDLLAVYCFIRVWSSCPLPHGHSSPSSRVSFDGYENNIQAVLASYLHVLGPAPVAKRRKGLLSVLNTILVDFIHCAVQEFGSHNDVVPSRFLNVLDGLAEMFVNCLHYSICRLKVCKRFEPTAIAPQLHAVMVYMSGE